MMAQALDTGFAAVPDWPPELAPAVCNAWPRAARAVADHVELGGFTDRLAWAELVGLDATLAAYRAVHGNNPKSSTRRHRPRPGQGVLA